MKELKHAKQQKEIKQIERSLNHFKQKCQILAQKIDAMTVIEYEQFVDETIAKIKQSKIDAKASLLKAENIKSSVERKEITEEQFK